MGGYPVQTITRQCTTSKETDAKSKSRLGAKGKQSKLYSQSQNPKVESPSLPSTRRAKARGFARQKTNTTFDAMTLNDLEAAVRQWSEERGIYEHSTSLAQFMKAVSEVGELADALMRAGKSDGVAAAFNRDAISDAIGDITVCLINVAHLEGFSLQSCLGAAWEQIRNRKGKMLPSGVFQKEA